MTVNKLTDVQVRNLKAKEKRYIVWEAGRSGFGVRVTPNGTKTFVYKYRFQGKVQWLTIGTYPAMTLVQAHKAHAEAREMVERGENPAAKAVAERREARQASTTAELANEYLEKWAKPRKRSWREDKRILEKDILPVWGTSKAKDITKRDVIQLLDRIMERDAPIMANRTLAVIRRMFNFAVERDIVTASPCLAVKAPAPENQRNRVLTAEEIRIFWHALEGEVMGRVNPFIKLILKLELITAQRKSECCAVAWEEVDLEEGWWTIPGEMTPLRRQYGVEEGLAKNRLPHRVPLSPLARDIFLAAKSLSGDSPWVFPSPQTSRPVTPTAINHAVRLHRDSLGVNFVPHDLRRTAASHMTGMGIPRLVVSKILNHVERGVTAVYDRHSYDREKRQALEAWGRRLQNIIQETDDKGKIVPFIRGF
jgi:integrase